MYRLLGIATNLNLEHIFSPRNRCLYLSKSQMNSKENNTSQSGKSFSRRNFINKVGVGSAATILSGSLGLNAEEASNQPIRWGFVGTGSIANSMAKSMKDAPSAKLIASSSRTLKKAEDFAKKYQAEKAFDSWAEMCQWDGIDAIYVATPTSVKEEITIAAAKAGKHVLCEKPLPSLAATQRMLAACRENNVAFMDGTHFSHHPRSIEIENKIDTLVGKRRTLHCVFQFNIRDKSNIRMIPALEPMGVIGDAGWYNMRGIVDYLPSNVELKSVSAFIRRDQETNAAIGGTGILTFADGSSATFSCAFDAGASRNEAQVLGDQGSIEIPKYISHDKDNSGSYTHSSRSNKPSTKTIKVAADRPDAAILFEDFAAQVHDPSLRKKWEIKSERTQALLDAVWASAIANE